MQDILVDKTKMFRQWMDELDVCAYIINKYYGFPF